MENYKVEPKDFNSPLMYHRLIESFKYGYAYRSQIGDPGDKNITRVVSEVKFFSHKGASIFYVDKILDFFDPPLSPLCR